tara:strand:- start:8112 stop:8579 length:468 start_codon:yes stop_codon:yes gene_type:complete
MATVQDYLNMAVSMTIGNKSGTDNQVLLPDDFRKFENLKVKTFSVTSGTIDAGNARSFAYNDSDDSSFLIFFSHPVQITHINDDQLVTASRCTASFFALCRNLPGTAGFGDGGVDATAANILQVNNTMHSPYFTAASGGATADVSWLKINIELEA